MLFLSYKALVTGHGCIVWSESCGWFGGVNWVRTLGGDVLLCFVYRVPAHAR